MVSSPWRRLKCRSGPFDEAIMDRFAAGLIGDDSASSMVNIQATRQEVLSYQIKVEIYSAEMVQGEIADDVGAFNIIWVGIKCL